MLPLPNASRKGRSSPYFTAGAAHHHLSSSQQILATLRSRTRLTNLAATLLVLALSGSLLLNLNFVFFSPRSPRHSPGYPYSYTAGSGWDDAASPEQLESPIPLSIETTLERDPRYAELEHLIMVPGHAIWLGHDANNVEEDDDWILEPMQKGGSVKTYVKHIERGVDELKADPKSLLVFSGYVLLLGRSPRGFQTSVLTECHATKKRRDQTSSLATYPRSSLLLSSSHGAFAHPLDFHLRFSQYVPHPSQLANSHRRICSRQLSELVVLHCPVQRSYRQLATKDHRRGLRDEAYAVSLLKYSISPTGSLTLPFFFSFFHSLALKTSTEQLFASHHPHSTISG